MYNINDAYINVLNEDHNIRAPYDRSRGQIDNILNLCDTISEKIGRTITFDNTYSNHYRLNIDDKNYEFGVYRDVINALEILISFI